MKDDILKKGKPSKKYEKLIDMNDINTIKYS